MINIPKGLKDVLPSVSHKWLFIETAARVICDLYGVKEIRTPVFEYTELFMRGVGEGTDIVSKEMYTFLDKGNRSITLKPEGTAGVVRSYLENGLFNEPSPQKLYYITPAFRYERPQAGRLREFHQFGVEIFGSACASMDFEVISLVYDFLKTVGIKEAGLEINSIGCSKCRLEYNNALKEYYKSNASKICATCVERLEKNPMRLLDCKCDGCKEISKNAPIILDYICEECASHFAEVKSYLDRFEIEYVVNPTIVRGLDYYTKTVFEFVSNYVGSQGTICGGGRYDGLVETLGGKPTPAIGFGVGIERLLMLLENTDVELPKPDVLDVFVSYIGSECKMRAMEVVKHLRERGFKADTDHMSRSVKAQFKYADRIGARCVVTIGSSELADNCVCFKNLVDKTEFRGTLEESEKLVKK